MENWYGKSVLLRNLNSGKNNKNKIMHAITLYRTVNKYGEEEIWCVNRINDKTLPPFEHLKNLYNFSRELFYTDDGCVFSITKDKIAMEYGRIDPIRYGIILDYIIKNDDLPIHILNKLCYIKDYFFEILMMIEIKKRKHRHVIKYESRREHRRRRAKLKEEDKV